MEVLEVVTRPQFHKAELAWLTEIRRKRTGNPGPPKFTLVFPGAQMPQVQQDAAVYAPACFYLGLLGA